MLTEPSQSAEGAESHLVSAPLVHPADLSLHLLLNLQHVPLELVLRDSQLLLQLVQQWPTVTPSGWCLAETQRHSAAAGTSTRFFRPAQLLVRHSKSSRFENVQIY